MRTFFPCSDRTRCAVILAMLWVTGLFSGRPVYAADVASWIEQEIESICELYLHLHRHPELTLQEKETAARIAADLRKAGYTVTTAVGGHGVVALLKNGDGPCVMLRCDMDALPVQEATGLEYASKATAIVGNDQKTGVMHACGHDIHMANLVATARYLAAHQDQWKGTLMLIAQPAEERGLGAKAMLEDGLFERFPKPDVAVALHVGHDLPTGKVGYCAGAMMANVDSVDITMKGRGGHGSAPHTTIDPVVQAAELVMSLQTIVSREIAPQTPAVVTVGSIHGGTQHNIIGDECQLQLTIRSYSDEIRKQLLDAIERKAKAVAMAARAPEPYVFVKDGTPSLFNNEDLANRLADVFRKTIGAENVVNVSPSMGGEDFSRYGRAGVPILMYRLGSVSPRRLERFAAAGLKPPSLHSAQYYPDFEEALQTGILTMSAAVLELMKP